MLVVLGDCSSLGAVLTAMKRNSKRIKDGGEGRVYEHSTTTGVCPRLQENKEIKD
jgi:hypothetical protein